MFIKKFLHKYLAPAGEEGSVIDRGDDFVSDEQEDDDPATKVAQLLAAAKSGPEGDETKPEGTTAETQEKPEGGKKGAIPFDRHEKVLAREREARQAVEARLAAYEGGREIANTNTEIGRLESSIEKLDDQYGKLVADGKLDEAAALMKDIRKQDRAAAELRSDMKTASAVAQATENVRFSTAMERVEAAYPALNEDHDDYDESTAKEVAQLLHAYKVMGMTPTAALQKAVKQLMPAETSKQAAAVTVKPTTDTEDVAKATAVITAAERKRTSIDKALETEKKQPPSLDKGGVNSDAVGMKIGRDITKDQKTFAKATEEEKARARGDVL